MYALVELGGMDFKGAQGNFGKEMALYFHECGGGFTVANKSIFSTCTF